jgi:hypothetical protein
VREDHRDEGRLDVVLVVRLVDGAAADAGRERARLQGARLEQGELGNQRRVPLAVPLAV